MSNDTERRVQTITLGSGSRIRLSPAIIKILGWGEYGESFECWGLFRRSGELLCAPVHLVLDDGTHPFGSALEYLNLEPTDTIMPIEEIPSACVITAIDRIFKIDAALVGEKKIQLDLKIGAQKAKKLGWNGQKTEVHVSSWGNVLIVLSDQRFNEVQDEDFTGGYLQE